MIIVNLWLLNPLWEMVGYRYVNWCCELGCLDEPMVLA